MTTDQDLARTCLTPNEYQAWILNDRGMSERTIALALSISRSSVRSRLENARHKLTLEKRKDVA